ncbi:cadherin-like beta sandwich domain-containing protein [Longibaculum muris]|uniref:cadherin-like beta sandwich domain-containing protein n=1 Tax=Longibaculum muris TaxID=1796628 RepID=UPI0022E171D3|nr:cadherin-like beta sandwich domain-containing protein [Longibaculum muris]
MKKIIYIFILTASFLLNTTNIMAASLTASLSSNKSTVTVGSSVKITAKVSGSKIYIVQGNVSSNNPSVLSGGGTIYRKADLGSEPNGFSSTSKTFTFTAQKVGTATISISDTGIGLTVNDSPLSFSGKSIVINVVEKNDSSTTNNQNSNSNTNTNNNNNSNSSNSDSSKKEENKSNDNKLSSLTISKGTLSPKFSANTTSYKVDLTSDIETVDIAAKANDSKAKVTGTGKKDLVIGSQTYSVTVVSESGIKKVYSITFNVTEKPTVFTQFGDQKLGILKDVAKIEVPEGYKETTVTLEGEEIRGWKNDKTGLTLVYLADENGHKSFYIYSDGKVANKYELITIAGKKYTLLDIPSDMKEQEGLKADKVKIGDMELDGWSYEDKNHANYAVVYLMNEAGEKNLYSYEKTEGTLQKYVVSEEKKANNTLTYVLAGTTALFALSTLGVYMMYMNFKKKSIATIKDYYDRKNQG